ncbi:MAG: hypothetical protein R3E97_22515 [Candidatus Eisenbacteria bacterium]
MHERSFVRPAGTLSPRSGEGRSRFAVRRAWSTVAIGCLLALSVGGCTKSLSGDDLVALGRPEAAVVVYGRDLSDGAEHHLKLGYAFLQAGLPSAAGRELSRARELAPKDPTAVFWLAELAAMEEEGDVADSLLALYAALRPVASTRPLLAGAEATEEAVARSLELARRHEVAEVLHPEGPRSDAILLALSSRVQGPGWGLPAPDGWDSRVTDAASRALGAPQLPDFPPPPSSHP